MSTRNRETLTMAATSIEAMTAKAMQMHPEGADARGYAWSLNINRSTDPVAIRGAEARGLQAFEITRWKVKVA